MGMGSLLCASGFGVSLSQLESAHPPAGAAPTALLEQLHRLAVFWMSFCGAVLQNVTGQFN